MVKVVAAALASTQFGRFLMVGVFAATINFLLRIVFSAVMNYPAAIVLAYAAGMLVAYVLNRRLVFETSRPPDAQEVWRFVAVNGFSLLQTLLVSLLFTWHLLPSLGVQAHAEEIGHFIGICVPVVTAYMGYKHWTFRKR